MPLRNLLRHKREYPITQGYGDRSAPEGADMSHLSSVDDYESRRARTPVPGLVGHAVETHLGRVYSREVSRGYGDETGEDDKPGAGAGPGAKLREFWRDVDGTGLDIDSWMMEEVAPILMAAGQVDILFDRPPAPPGQEIETALEEESRGIDRALACVLLPANVLWWRLDPVTRQYEEVLIQEWHEAPDGSEVARFRHWTPTDSTLYDDQGKAIGPSVAHGYGRPPVRRVLYRRNVGCRNVGVSPVEEVAEIMRAVYNAWSELILGDVLQAFPTLQGPPELMSADGVPVGPQFGIAMCRNPTSGALEGIEYVDPPKGSAESARENLRIALDRADRAAGLTKPAGTTTGGTVAQSGLSKSYDQKEGNARLGKTADKLAACERVIAQTALSVRLGRPLTTEESDSIHIGYSKEFDLWTANDLADLIADFQKMTTGAGELPGVDAALIKLYVREVMRGLADDVYAAMDAEIDEWLARKADQKAEAREKFGEMLDTRTGKQGKISSDDTDEPPATDLPADDDEDVDGE